MTTPDPQVVDGWLRHLVTVGTSREVAHPPASTLDTAWDAVFAAATLGRVTGALNDVTGALAAAIDPGYLAAAEAAHRAAQVTALRLERMAIATAEALDRAGIPVRMLKGPAVAHLDYPRPEMRDFGDIDILVRSSDMSQAVASLEDVGFRRLLPAAHPSIDRVFAKSVTFLAEDGTELDLHRTLTTGSFGSAMPLDVLWRGGDRLVIGARPMTALGPDLRLVNTAVHLRLGSRAPRLSTRRDLVVQSDLVPLPVAVAAAESLGVAAVLQAAVVLCRDEGTPCHDDYDRWAAAHRPSLRDVERLRTHVQRQDDFGRRAVSSLVHLDWRDRLTVAMALVLPRRAHLEARGLTRGAHLRGLASRTR